MRKLKVISTYIIIIIVFCIIGKSQANYKSSFYKTGSGKIAKPIVKVINSQEKILENVNPETLFESYYFQVVNYENENVNEVPLEFSITILNNTDISPVSYKIVDIDNEKEILENEKIFLKPNEKETKKYKVDLIWNLNNSLSTLENENKIKIQINAVQKI